MEEKLNAGCGSCKYRVRETYYSDMFIGYKRDVCCKILFEEHDYLNGTHSTPSLCEYVNRDLDCQHWEVKLSWWDKLKKFFNRG
jgi:hypothetical protein